MKLKFLLIFCIVLTCTTLGCKDDIINSSEVTERASTRSGSEEDSICTRLHFSSVSDLISKIYGNKIDENSSNNINITGDEQVNPNFTMVFYERFFPWF